MKILLVQTSFLGDTILSTPVIAGIHKAFPKAELWMMTTPESAYLVSRDPLMTGIIPYDKRKSESGFSGVRKMAERLKEMQFDRVYALHRSPRTAVLLKLSGIPVRIGFRDAKLNFLYTRTQPRSPNCHDILRNLSILYGDIPLSMLNTDIRLFAPDKDAVSLPVRELFSSLKKYVIMMPGSVWNTKRWDWEGFREVVKYLNRTDYRVVLSGSSSERPLTEKIAAGLDAVNLAGKITIPEAMFLTRHAALVVCNDSMSLHMASAFRIPNVAIFCATSPEFGFSPWKNNSIVVERADLPCKPCRRHGSVQCPAGTWECIKGLSPALVIDAVNRLLNLSA